VSSLRYVNKIRKKRQLVAYFDENNAHETIESLLLLAKKILPIGLDFYKNFRK